MEVPQVVVKDLILGMGLVILIGYALLIQTDSTAKDLLIKNLTENLTKLTTVQSFVYDYNEYSSICNRFQIEKAELLKKQCTSIGLTFLNYYVSYPSNDFLITCISNDGKTQVLRFR